jgi:hypothetical protein
MPAQHRPPPAAQDEDRDDHQPPLLPEIVASVSSKILPPLPLVTASPPPCCSYADNEVIIQLSTTVTIPDYHRYYDAPIDSFAPAYYALPDGSLVTPTYLSNLRSAYFNLIFLCALIMIFFRNILVSGDYVRRGKVKKKGLFYLLFASQILGPVVLLPPLIAYFHESMDCTLCVVLYFRSVFGGLISPALVSLSSLAVLTLFPYASW